MRKFREIESEMVKLLEVLDRHIARHLFRSSDLIITCFSGNVFHLHCGSEHLTVMFVI